MYAVILVSIISIRWQMPTKQRQCSEKMFNNDS